MAAPVRPGLHPQLLQRYEARVAALPGIDVQWDDRPWLADHGGENYWGRFARGRQRVVDERLRDEHDWVLWIDSDLDFEPDLLWRLLATSERAVVSPVIVIENDGRQYDTAGTRPSFEQRSSDRPPEPGIYEMYSVGGCVLVPAEVHRQVSFAAQPDSDTTANTEWTSLCQGAWNRGYPVLWNTMIRVEHANLPSYGEAWH